MVDKIKEIIKPILDSENIELVDLIYRIESGRNTLRLLVDREGGIRLSDCARLNELIGTLLDETNLITERYVLEVNSPGVDRVFETKRDYERAKGRLVRVSLNLAILDKKEYIGRLIEVTDGSIKIDTSKKGIIEILFENVSRARQEIEF